MHHDPLRAPLLEARALATDHHYGAALAALDEIEAPPARAAELDVVRVHALAGLERFGTCFQIVHGLLQRDELGVREWVEARLLRARLLRKASPIVDEAIDLAHAAADRAAASSFDAARLLAAEARCEASYLWARKRCRKLAERELDAADEALPGDGLIPAARGWVCIDFDERADAMKHFRTALGAGGRGARLGRLGLAYVATLAGEFEAAHDHLAAVDTAAEDLAALRALARLLAAQHSWDDVAELLGRLIGISPHGDFARWDNYHRAMAYYRAGAPQKALAGFAQLVESGEEDEPARKARRMVRLLDRRDVTALPRKRLKAFPSVAQLRDHCGPASCELYLRFFGIPAEQVEIARQIKQADGGTPVYRMRRYLAQAGLSARRVEADLDKLRKLIDAGIPVIMEEDYSETRHVAVAIGYDDVREVLEVQDPMTHEIRETFYEELPKLRELSNHGALVAVPAGEEATLDAVGAVECRYIALVDEAWAASDDNRPDEGDRLVEESLALRRDYELAWFYRFRRARLRAGDGPEGKVALHQVLGEISSLWPDDEWPQQLVGEVLYFDRRYDEALAAFETARDRDATDAHNWSMIADCLICLDRHDDAYRALEKALELDPAQVRANENQAWLANRRGESALAWILSSAALELNGSNPFNHLVRARLLTARDDLAAALAAYDEAHRLDPARDDVIIERAKTLAKLGRVDDAAEFLRGRDRPGDVTLRIELADLLYNHGRFPAAAEVAREILTREPGLPTGQAILGASLAATGDLEAGFASMRQALTMRPTYAWVYLQMGKALRAAGRAPEALQPLAASLGLRSTPESEYALGDALAAAGHPREALDYLWRAGVKGHLGGAELERIGRLLVESGWDAHAFFREVEGKRDGDLAVLRAHARTLLEAMWAPQAAAPVLSRIRDLDPEDAYARASLGAELMDRSLASEQEGEALLRAAVAAAPDLEYPRRVLGERLAERGRYSETLETLSPCGEAYTVQHYRVRALLGLDRLDEVDELCAGFERRWGEPGKTPVGALMLRYRAARRRWQWQAALELAEAISRENNERDDDGRLDHWEEEKFECLCRLNEIDRALRFGVAQAVDGPSLGRLAYGALTADRVELARELAARALRLSTDETQALHVTARLAELDGGAGGARALHLWERVATLDPSWHVPRENVARVLLGTGGEAARALAEADATIALGHLCPAAFAVRAQARLLSADRDGASSDLERAWLLSQPEDREHDGFDAWALRARLHGDGPASEACLEKYLRGAAPVSPADRARVGRVVEAW